MFKKFVIAYDHRVNSTYIEKIKETLKGKGIDYLVVEDDGETNDYPLLAQKCHEWYKENSADGMILLCGTGIGMNVVANKFDGIRSVLAHSVAEAYFSRRHEDSNSLVFGAGYSDGKHAVSLELDDMAKMIEVFVETPFEGDRHIRRLGQITDLEKSNKNIPIIRRV